jgi:hypothetical protein
VTNGVDRSPVYFGDLAYCVEGVEENQPRHFYGLTALTGKPQLRQQLQPDASGNLLAGEDGVMVQLGTRFLSVVNPAPGAAWRSLPCFDARGLPETRQGMFVAAQPPGLVTRDLISGEKLWSAEALVLGGPVIFANLICVGTSNGLGCFSLADGRAINVLPGGAPATPLMRHGEKLAWINAQSELIVANPMGGQVLANQPGALTNVPPVMVSDKLLYATADAIMACDLVEFKPRIWLATAGLGKITAPIIISHGGIYFATDKQGLIRAEKP